MPGHWYLWQLLRPQRSSPLAGQRALIQLPRSDVTDSALECEQPTIPDRSMEVGLIHPALCSNEPQIRKLIRAILPFREIPKHDIDAYSMPGRIIVCVSTLIGRRARSPSLICRTCSRKSGVSKTSTGIC